MVVVVAVAVLPCVTDATMVLSCVFCLDNDAITMVRWEMWNLIIAGLLWTLN